MINSNFVKALLGCLCCIVLLSISILWSTRNDYKKMVNNYATIINRLDSAYFIDSISTTKEWHNIQYLTTKLGYKDNTCK